MHGAEEFLYAGKAHDIGEGRAVQGRSGHLNDAPWRLPCAFFCWAPRKTAPAARAMSAAIPCASMLVDFPMTVK
jgi:hypothetical protein